MELQFWDFKDVSRYIILRMSYYSITTIYVSLCYEFDNVASAIGTGFALVLSMISQRQQGIQISSIVDTITDPERGSGILGFVITFPNGKMNNQAIEYNSVNYQEIAMRINDLYQKAQTKYGKAKTNNSINNKK